MPRYRGTVTQSILDWYAAQAMAAQQWFTSAALNYWSFSLVNNATDGRRLWVYDAETVSGAAFPAGTGNPGGNPNSQIGYQGGGGTPSGWALVSQTNNITPSGGVLTISAPAAIVAGNLILVVFIGGSYAASLVNPPDATWTRLAGADGNVNSQAMVAFGHIATNSEPSSYAFTYTTSPVSNPGAMAMQFSGNTNPLAVDNFTSNVGLVASTSMVAPGLTLTQPGDLIITAYGTTDQPQTIFHGDASFTVAQSILANGKRFWVGYKTAPLSGAVGPFIGATSPAGFYEALSISIKAANVGSAPAQSLVAPIASVTPVSPGIFTLGFSGVPIAFGGITRWIPPASHFAWHREAPLAVLQAGDQFNLAGISPENAAWGSVTWIAVP
jgi:hypothetical protein